MILALFYSVVISGVVVVVTVVFGEETGEDVIVLALTSEVTGSVLLTVVVGEVTVEDVIVVVVVARVVVWGVVGNCCCSRISNCRRRDCAAGSSG